MPVTKEQVLATAALCRLDVSIAPSGATDKNAEARIERMASQMDSIVGYMDILNAVNTDDVEPLFSPMQEVAPPREDLALRKLTPEEVLVNAPKRRQNFFIVPPVI